MPITGKQFDLGIDREIEEWMKKVHPFLVAHIDQAYTELEIAKALDIVPEDATGLGTSDILKMLERDFQGPQYPQGYQRKEAEIGLFRTALEKLLETYHVDRREVRGQMYYRAVRKTLTI